MVSISQRKQKAIVMFKTLNKQMPTYMQDTFSVRDFCYDIRRYGKIFKVPLSFIDRLPCEPLKPLTLTRFKEGINHLNPSTDAHTANTKIVFYSFDPILFVLMVLSLSI